ncbi:HEAT repeat domain-containing protein [Tautonia plasticadhaerens]|uniref:PBS lyase HEAT-like repeat protein n=1 Tax=Tautonia plasticadhaerens TaxID=2527974 RepID=A0A518GVR0_9BACT|nr:HEAT repeat domain-containing protein [Tautonia plasticadhaerens]QDV32649.1 PBS lyase HEAT-like repeat protein [Tautonia plasticadhaerens]
MPSDRTSGGIAWVVGVAALAWAPDGARADELTIRGGGRLSGEVVPVEGMPDQVEVYTPTNPRPYRFRRDQIVQVVSQDGPLDEYLRRRAEVEPTAEAHHALGLWCEDQGLTGPALAQFELAAQSDEGHEEAQKKLGRVFFDGRWMTYDERRELQGLIQHEGRWITPEQKDDLDERARLTESQEAWGRRLDILVTKFAGGEPADRDEAAAQLGAIRDPEAVVPLVNRLGREGPELRLMLAQILGVIDDPMAAAGLVHRVVKEDDAQVRLATLNELARSQDPDVVPRLIRTLKQDDPEEVGRAASALAGLNAIEAVPRLIPVLVTPQKRVETVLVPSPPAGGGMGISAGFGQTGPAFGFGGGPSIPVLTGPAVAPGAIAFGVQAVPIYQYAAQANGFAFGGGGGVTQQAPPVPRQVVRTYAHRNVEVLAALERLTGKNYGFEVDVWNRWLRNEFRLPVPEDRPDRLVPQP